MRPTTPEQARFFRELAEQYGLGGAIALRLLMGGALTALFVIPMLLHERVFESRRAALWLALVPALGAAVCAVALLLIGLVTEHRLVWALAGVGALVGAGLEMLYVVPAAVALARQRYYSNKRA